MYGWRKRMALETDTLPPAHMEANVLLLLLYTTA